MKRAARIPMLSFATSLLGATKAEAAEPTTVVDQLPLVISADQLLSLADRAGSLIDYSTTETAYRELIADPSSEIPNKTPGGPELIEFKRAKTRRLCGMGD